MNCIKFLLLLTFFISTAASAQSTSASYICSPKNAADISSKSASAAALMNLSNLPGSLKYELNELITNGLAKLPANKAYLAISVIPSKFQDSYHGKETCQQLLSETTASPLSYKNMTFSSKDKLINWFYDFTQGKGADGKDLYNRCPGLCSPQYTTAIRSRSDELLLDVFVVCGHARNKWENTYHLKSYLSSSCS